MADKKAEDTSKPNIKAKSDYRLKGKPVVKGQVVSKKDFPNKSDWQNLCHMTPPRAEETSDKVGTPAAPKAEGDTGKKKAAGGGKGKMPGT